MTLTNTQVVITNFVFLYLFSNVNVTISAVIPSKSTLPTTMNGIDNISQVKEERVDIVYNTADLKEINHDGILKLQVIGNASLVAVNCQYTGNILDPSHVFVDWTYDGLDEV